MQSAFARPLQGGRGPQSRPQSRRHGRAYAQIRARARTHTHTQRRTRRYVDTRTRGRALLPLNCLPACNRGPQSRRKRVSIRVRLFPPPSPPACLPACLPASLPPSARSPACKRARPVPAPISQKTSSGPGRSRCRSASTPAGPARQFPARPGTARPGPARPGRSDVRSAAGQHAQSTCSE